jgi:hypothetical protein
MLGDIGDYLKATIGEIGHHPLQAAGAALGVPGYDPFFGGIFNNHKGGALLSPTGNFTSSAWGEMYKDNPNSTAGLNLFHRINSAADVIAPTIAGAYGLGSLGAGASGASSPGGVGGLTGLFSGPAAYGDSGLTGAVSASGSGLSGVMGADMGGALGSAPTGLFSGLLPGGGMAETSSGALGGGLSGDVAGASPLGGASMGGLDIGQFANLAQQLMRSRQRQAQDRQQDNEQGLPIQKTMPPVATVVPFSPVKIMPTATPTPQMYAQGLVNYGVY